MAVRLPLRNHQNRLFLYCFPLSCLPRSFMRNWLLASIVALPVSLCAQAIVTVPPEQCVYKVGDDPRWAAADLDESGWKPFSQYMLTGDMTVVWARCHTNVDLAGVRQPAVEIAAYGYALQAFVNGRPIGVIANSEMGY